MIKQIPWTLRFSREIEEQFKADYFSTTLLRTRLGILLGGIFYGSFVILDSVSVPEVLISLSTIRFLVVLPYITFLLVMTFTDFYRRHQQKLNALGILIAGGGIVGMTLIRPEYTFSYYAGIILVLIYAYLLMGLRFYWASGAGGVVVISYVLGIELFTDIPFQRSLNNYFFLLGSNFLLMFGAYFVEVLRRQDFFVRIQLNREQAKIEAINEDLENRITERTRDLEQEVIEKQIAQEDTHQALLQKEALLKEVYHRTKNNMNVIISLLNLQAHEQQDRPSSDVFKQLSDRIYSMSLVHEQLYRSDDFSTIRLLKYIDKLCIQRRYSLLENLNRVKFEIEGDEVSLGLEQAVPLGLALSEIISNAIIHGYSDGSSGLIRFRLRQLEQERIEILVCNDGIPIAPGILLSNQETLGFRLMNILIVDQLGGSIELETNRGTCFRIQVAIKK